MLLKKPLKVGQGVETRGRADGCNGQLRGREQGLSELEPQRLQVRLKGLSESLVKAHAKIVRGEARLPGYIGQRERFAKMVFHIDERLAHQRQHGALTAQKGVAGNCLPITVGATIPFAILTRSHSIR